jgi:hypothetical protein
VLPVVCFHDILKASAGGNRITVLGAVNAVTKQASAYANTTHICSNCQIAFLKQIREQYGDKSIALVLDNVRYQHCFAVIAFAKSLGIHLLFFAAAFS